MARSSMLMRVVTCGAELEQKGLTFFGDGRCQPSIQVVSNGDMSVIHSKQRAKSPKVTGTNMNAGDGGVLFLMEVKSIYKYNV